MLIILNMEPHNTDGNIKLFIKETRTLITFSVLAVLLNSPNLSPYFSLNKFARIFLLFLSSLLCLILNYQMSYFVSVM